MSVIKISIILIISIAVTTALIAFTYPFFKNKLNCILALMINIVFGVGLGICLITYYIGEISTLTMNTIIDINYAMEITVYVITTEIGLYIISIYQDHFIKHCGFSEHIEKTPNTDTKNSSE
jgi:hypothetical protein